MYEVWQACGSYVEGTNIYKRATKSLQIAKNRAQKIEGFVCFETPGTQDEDVFLWITGEGGKPLGLIKKAEADE